MQAASFERVGISNALKQRSNITIHHCNLTEFPSRSWCIVNAASNLIKTSAARLKTLTLTNPSYTNFAYIKIYNLACCPVNLCPLISGEALCAPIQQFKSILTSRWYLQCRCKVKSLCTGNKR